MKKYIKFFVVLGLLGVAGVVKAFWPFMFKGEEQFGAFGDPFLSIQLA